MTDPVSALGTVFAFYGIMMLVFLVLGIVALVFWINMFIKAIKHDFEHTTLWILVVIFGQAIDAILSYFIVYKDGSAPDRGEFWWQRSD